jgi:DNA-directed RNA polymerase III subunit RPC8
MSLSLPLVRSVPREKVWFWVHESGNEYYYEAKERVRFRVESEVWCDQAPGPPKQVNEDDKDASETEKKVPYTIIVSIYLIESCLEQYH